MSKTNCIIILSPGFPADEHDTTCIPPMQIFTRGLKQHNQQTKIVVVSFQYPFSSANYKWHGVDVIALAGKGKGQVFRLITWRRVWHTLKSLHNQHHVLGLLSFWMGECSFVGNRFANKYGLKHYMWLLGQDAKSGNGYVNRIKPLPESVIAISDALADEFNLNYNIAPKYVIPSGIDTTVFGESIQTRDIDIIGVGSLIPLKQYSLFITIIKKLTACFPNVKTVICGKGPEVDNLQKQIDKLQLGNNVQLCGELAHPEVLAYMQRSKILLHTSSYEGYSTVISEALYAGCEVVSLVKGMNKRPKQHHVPDNAELIPDILIELLNRPALTHEQILSYPVEKIAQTVTDLFAH